MKWSMDKINTITNAIDKWKKFKGPYVLSAKLDGISALYIRTKYKRNKNYIHEKGIIGQILLSNSLYNLEK